MGQVDAKTQHFASTSDTVDLIYARSSIGGTEKQDFILIVDEWVIIKGERNELLQNLTRFKSLPLERVNVIHWYCLADICDAVPNFSCSSCCLDSFSCPCR